MTVTGDTIASIRGAMADAMRTGLGGDVEVFPYARVSPAPAGGVGVQILPPEIEFDFSFARGLDVWVWTVQAFCALNEEVSPQQNLDELIAAGGIKASLEADRSLGGLIAELRVESSGPPRQVIPDGGYPMLLVEFRVSMRVPGT